MTTQHSSTEPTSLRARIIGNLSKVQLYAKDHPYDVTAGDEADIEHATTAILAAFTEEIAKLREQAQTYTIRSSSGLPVDKVIAVPLSALDKWVEGLTK